jgi:hypothetical protein
MFALTATASAYEEHQFCTGKNLSGEEGCGSGEWYIHAAYANGTSAPICLTGPEQVGGGCMHVTNEGIYIGASEPYGYWGRVNIVHTINQPPTKVYGTFWTGPPAPAGSPPPPPPPPPPTWHLDNLGTLGGGKSLTEDPDVASWGGNRLDVFARASDGTMVHKWWGGTGWSSWETLGSPGEFLSGVGAVGQTGNRVDAVARSTGNSVVDMFYLGGTWHTENFGGTTSGDPDFSSANGANDDIWIRGASGTLEHRWWMGSAWSPWESLGTPISSSPSAVSWNGGRLDIVARASDNSVTHIWWDGSLHSESLGGSIVGKPTVSSWGPERLDVFARGTNNHLMHKWFDHGYWSPWEDMGGNLASSPGAVSWGPGRVDVVARSAEDDSMLHWWYG